jgi:biopolymer transport protein ExbD
MAHGPSGGGGQTVEVNLIPMIDIVIQLITFFLMLVNFDNANSDERVRLPIADLAKPSDMEIEEPLFLNVNREGWVTVGVGDVSYEPESEAFRHYIANEAAATLFAMKSTKRRIKTVGDRKQLWTTVLIRADQEVDYGRIQRIIKTCQDHGYYKFALRATPPSKM